MYASVLPGTAIVIESFELERTHKGHLVQVPYHEQGHLQLDQFAQRPVQPDLVCLQGWSTYHLSGNLHWSTVRHLHLWSNIQRTCGDTKVTMPSTCSRPWYFCLYKQIFVRSFAQFQVAILCDWRRKAIFFFFCIFVFLWLLFRYLVLICGCWKGRNLLQLSYCKSSMLSEGTVCASVEESLYDPAHLIFMFHFVTIWKKKW